MAEDEFKKAISSFRQKDIKADAILVPTSDGVEARYVIKVYDETGNITASESTSDYAKAQKFYNKQKSQNPNYTTNGKQLSDPFQDGSMALTSAEARALQTSLESPLAEDDIANSSDKKAQLQALNPQSPTGRVPKTSNINKPVYDYSGFCEEKAKFLHGMSRSERADQGYLGLNCGIREQPVTNRPQGIGEKVIPLAAERSNNALIVIGNDRVDELNTGYGGGGHTQCDMIDIVAGLGGPKPVQAVGPCTTEDPPAGGSLYFTNPNFYVDAARVYISQKTDVDKNFGIGSEENYFRTIGKSAIAIKADNVRLIGRESLILVTNTDAKNSQGGEIRQFSGIHLMANNDDQDMQPIPKGENLQRAFLQLTEMVEELAGTLDSYIEYQRAFNDVVQHHVHISPFKANPTTPSMTTEPAGMKMAVQTVANSKLSVLKGMTNLQTYKMNFLMQSGGEYINSRYNKTN
jgi:hypothetical protein